MSLGPHPISLPLPALDSRPVRAVCATMHRMVCSAGHFTGWGRNLPKPPPLPIPARNSAGYHVSDVLTVYWADV